MDGALLADTNLAGADLTGAS
ncbi:MAG: hypothetical protein V3U73_07225 [bacterium]